MSRLLATAVAATLFASTASAQYPVNRCGNGSCATTPAYRPSIGLLPAISRFTQSTFGAISGTNACQNGYNGYRVPAANLSTYRIPATQTICGPNGCQTIPNNASYNAQPRFGTPLGNGHFVDDGRNQNWRPAAPTNSYDARNRNFVAPGWQQPTAPRYPNPAVANPRYESFGSPYPYTNVRSRVSGELNTPNVTHRDGDFY